MRTPYEKMLLARKNTRPNFYRFTEAVFENFIELSGDRRFGDDKALAGGVATLAGRPVTVIGTVKGEDTNENIRRSFGMPSPEGYRKAVRLMDQAEKFGRPVVCLIDTPGAYPGIGAEERGQGEAIAASILRMTSLRVPAVSVITGEGGSGGALALGVANRVLMLENAVYSVISPNGFASILWKDAKKEAQAASLMKMTAQDLLEYQIIDGIIPEHPEGAHIDPAMTFAHLKASLAKELEALCLLSAQELTEQRRVKFRAFGVYGA